MFIILAIVGALALVGGGSYALFFGGSANQTNTSPVNLQKGLVGWWKLNGNAKDGTPQGNDGIWSGTASYTTDRSGKANGAASFNNTKIGLSLANSAKLQIGTGSMSWSLWFNTSQTDIDGGLYRFSDGNNAGGIYMDVTSSGSIACSIAGVRVASTASGYNNARWRNVTCVLNRSANTLSIYVDGGSVKSVSASSIAGIDLESGSQPLFGYVNATDYLKNGALSDVRVYSRSLSAVEATALYKESSSGVNAAQGSNGLLGQWKLDGNTKDNTPYADNGVGSNLSSAADRKNNANQAVAFNGTNSQLSMAVAKAAGANNYSFGVWFKPTAACSSIACGLIGNDNNPRITWGLPTAGANQQTVHFIVSSSTGTAACSKASSVLTLNAWHQVYITATNANSTNASVTYYVDGQSLGTCNPGVSTYALQSAFYLGRRDNTTLFQGSMDDARIYSRALSASEVATLYTTYDSSLKLGVYSAGAGLVGNWAFNGNIKDGTPYADDATNYGGTPTTDRKGTANSAYAFDGVSAYMTMPNASQLNSGSMTVSFWFTLNSEIDCDSNNNYRSLIRKTTSQSGTSAGWDVVLEQTKGTQFDVGFNGATHRSGAVSVGVAIGVPVLLTYSYNAQTGVAATYANGVQRSAITWSSPKPLGATTAPLTLAGGNNTGSCPSGSGYTPGTYDDVRVYNRALTATEVSALYASYN